ncbi:recombinase family protein [Streptomyces sp. NBC_00208]|uniref:recombinase family protein n=1 Tax=Streptomyces sp. NBC_00208 TaxID=2975681 RepID=UPI002E2E3430|nr:recombinase family protein [Streptomyces sp. NBC_00208]
MTQSIAVYIRLSRESEDSASIETQRAAAQRWLEQNGHGDDQDNVTYFTDAGVSGAMPLEQRSGMRALMESRPDIVVTWKQDRYARSVTEFLRLVAWAEKGGTSLATADGNLDTSTPHGRMVANVLASLASWEREIISARITEGHATRRAQGRWGSGRAPYGYRTERRDGAAYLTVDDEQAALIRTAVAKLIEDGTVASTARMTGLSEPQWRRLLKSPTLRGMRSHKGALVLAADGVTPVQFAEPIINAAEAKAVRQRLLALATGTDRAPRKAAPLCAGMAHCYRCAGRLNGGTSDKGVALYRCKAGHTTIYAATLDERVSEAFLSTWGAFAEHRVSLEGGNDLSGQLAEIDEQLRRAVDMRLTAGPATLGILEEKQAELEAAYARLRAAHDPDVREVLVPTGRTLADTWEAAPEDRPRLLADMGLSVTLHPKQRAERLVVTWGPAPEDDALDAVLREEFLGDADA